MKDIINTLLNLLPQQIAYAHCDIPCGIYDVHNMQMAAHTIIRMTDMIMKAHIESEESEGQIKLMHHVARLTCVKEEHAELLKHEVRVLWGDYFNEEHLKEYSDLHSLVFIIMKLASKARQELNIDTSQELLGKVQELAEIFYKTKGLTPVRVKSPYPTGGEIVLHK